ncbi:MAG: ABC transporter ATP-binding protein [Acidimicrobiales bacterium]
MRASPAAPATTVWAEGLRRSYGRLGPRATVALDGVDLSVGAGVTGLLGPNGAGKTTLLDILATVASPDAGSLRILGRDPARAEERVQIRRRLGYLPQEPGFHRHFSAFEFVDYVAILKEMVDHRARHEEVRRVLEAVGLERVASRKVKALSGGMRQRLGLAQALLGDPRLLVLDEPTAGLDPEQRLRFREVVSDLGEGRTVVLSTHQAEDVAALCQRVVVLDGGRTRFDGPPGALADTARGRVWWAERRHPEAAMAWRDGDGRWRHVGDMPPAGAVEPVEPSVADGYLLLLGRPAEDAPGPSPMTPRLEHR